MSSSVNTLFGSSWALTAFAAALTVGCASADRAISSPVEDQSTTPANPVAKGRVLFVLTAAGEQVLANGKARQTGFFLGEFYEAYRAVSAAGYDVEIATPGGEPPVVDPESSKSDYWKDQPQWREAALGLVEGDPRFREPWSLAKARRRADEFAGVVVPGGQGVMIDLLDNPDLHDIIVHHGRTGRAVGLICHAPAILTRLRAEDNPFEGRTVTSVSGFEEWYIERFVMKGRAADRAIGKHLRRQGYRHKSAFPGKSMAVRDCNLVTSQNPFSGAAFSEVYVAALEAPANNSCTMTVSRR